MRPVLQAIAGAVVGGIGVAVLGTQGGGMAELAVAAKDWVAPAVNVGAFGLVSWLVKHTFSHTIPRLAGDFKAVLGEQRKEFLEALERQDKVHREELAVIRIEQREERKHFLAQVDALRKEVVAVGLAVVAK